MRDDFLRMEIGNDDNVYKLKTGLASAGIHLTSKIFGMASPGKSRRYNHDDDDENTSIIETAFLPHSHLLAACETGGSLSIVGVDPRTGHLDRCLAVAYS